MHIIHMINSCLLITVRYNLGLVINVKFRNRFKTSKFLI